jgi:hypothetical protein
MAKLRQVFTTTAGPIAGPATTPGPGDGTTTATAIPFPFQQEASAAETARLEMARVLVTALEAGAYTRPFLSST